MTARFALLALALTACTQAPAQNQSGANEVVGVVSVIDGDTIEMHGTRIRIHGVDTPERGRMCGPVNAHQRASLALSDFIGRQTVRCEIKGQDRYERSIGECRVGANDVAAHMAEEGWARDWPRYSGGAYADEEARARAARRGLWAMECPGLWGERDYRDDADRE